MEFKYLFDTSDKSPISHHNLILQAGEVAIGLWARHRTMREMVEAKMEMIFSYGDPSENLARATTKAGFTTGMKQ